MPDNFDDALERLDFEFDDFDTFQGMLERLRSILGQDHISPLQRQIAETKALRDRNELITGAIERGLGLDIFQRRGQQVFQLRDPRGRFIASGARGVRTFFERNPSNL